jgi:hypothetical protein
MYTLSEIHWTKPQLGRQKAEQYFMKFPNQCQGCIFKFSFYKRYWTTIPSVRESGAPQAVLFSEEINVKK